MPMAAERIAKFVLRHDRDTAFEKVLPTADSASI